MIENDKTRLEEPKEEDEGANMNDPKGHYVIPWKGFVIFVSIVIVLMIVCVVVIILNGGFDQWTK